MIDGKGWRRSNHCAAYPLEAGSQIQRLTFSPRLFRGVFLTPRDVDRRLTSRLVSAHRRLDAYFKFMAGLNKGCFRQQTMRVSDLVSGFSQRDSDDCRRWSSPHMNHEQISRADRMQDPTSSDDTPAAVNDSLDALWLQSHCMLAIPSIQGMYLSCAGEFRLSARGSLYPFSAR